MLHVCPDALRADLRRVYGLDLDDLWAGRLRPSVAGDITANLPPGSLVWRRLDTAAAWTPAEYLLAVQIDQMNMWMWGNADPKKRGPNPRPLPRPGRMRGADSGQPDDGQEHRVRKIEVQPMTPDEFARWRAQRFRDAGTRRSMPLKGGTEE